MNKPSINQNRTEEAGSSGLLRPSAEISPETEADESVYTRTRQLIGDPALSKLQAAHVAVFGLGGVGSYVTEALCRAGIGSLSLIDSDIICESNLNRQLYALRSTVGRPKTELAKERCFDICPDCRTFVYRRFVLPDTLDALMQEISGAASMPDFLVDAVDTVSAKIALSVYAEQHGIPLISCCGTGNKLNPAAFEIADLYQTSVCPLCRVLRKELKERGVKKLTVCYSKEQPVRTQSRTPASISFVPPAAGLLIASHVTAKLLSE